MAAITVPPLARDLPSVDGSGASSNVAPGAPGSFAEVLGQAVAGVDELQGEADRSAQHVALGGGNLHETALALEKADVAMRVAVKVRNKLVEAYQDVMRMTV